MPGSYKLWYNFLADSRQFVEQFQLRADAEGEDVELSGYHQVVLSLHEASLQYMFNMPKIWLDYAEFSATCQSITGTRLIYDRALQTLPVTQHKLIWEQYVQWAVGLTNSEDDEDDEEEKQSHFADTAIHVYKRYIKLVP